MGQAIGQAEHVNTAEMTFFGHLLRLGGASQARAPRPRSVCDQRVVVITIMPEGEQVTQRAEAVFEQVLKVGLGNTISENETAVLLATLNKIQGRLGVPGGAVLPPWSGASWPRAVRAEPAPCRAEASRFFARLPSRDRSRADRGTDPGR